MVDLAQVGSSGPWHAAFPYGSPDELTAAVAELVKRAAGAADPVLIAAAEPNLGLLRARLDGQCERVTWADMHAMGLNPARLIAAFRVFADEHRDRVVWCVQEPGGTRRSREELDEVIRHEALMNLAFADDRVRILCPYPTRLGEDVITCVERTHPVVVRDGRSQRSASYATAGLVPEECDRPLGSPPAEADVLPYRDQMAVVRQFTAERARRAGLPPDRVDDVVFAVGELAANTFVHTSGPGWVTAWATDGEFICQVHDGGQIANPLAGRLRTDPAAPGGGQGLWVVHQLCDLVQLRTGPAGTTIRLHMRLSPEPGCRPRHADGILP